MPSSIQRNTLLAESSIDKIISTTKDKTIFADIAEILLKFQDIKKFASEIHTEIHLVKPILKILGYTYESKPKFFEEHVKDPDVALFVSEADLVGSPQLWGTKDYFRRSIALLQLKRYGRTLEKGISGFYLDFESKIPIYQMMYLLKKANTPWGILTNGRDWILLRRPRNFEKRLIEIDIEDFLSGGNEETIHLFFHLFSLMGLTKTIPGLLDLEREELMPILREKKRTFRESLHQNKKKTKVYPRLIDIYRSLFPDRRLGLTERYLKDRGVSAEERHYQSSMFVNTFNMLNISSYLYTGKNAESNLNIEEILLDNKDNRYTKDELLSLKILDMTPNFGGTATRLVESMAYLSFVLPYRDKSTFIAEWEDEHALKRYIINNVLYGIGRSHFSLDILQNTLHARYGVTTKNFRFGNPLIGMSLQHLMYYFDENDQPGLFIMNPREVLDNFKDTYKLYFSLSDRIKEDMEMKKSAKIRLDIYSDRIKDVLDIITATHFSKAVDNKKIRDVLASLDGDESTWEELRKKQWFLETQEIALKNGFFHMEMEFPFLLGDSFDFIFAEPSVYYLWEDDIPTIEASKLYIKRGMQYLKHGGRMILCLDGPNKTLMDNLSRSKKYEATAGDGYIMIERKKYLI